MRVFFLVTEKEEESWGEVIREGRNEPKGERNLWSSVNEGSRNQRQIKRGKFSTFFCLFIFLKGPCRADIAVLETAHYFFDGGRGVGKFLHANIFLNVFPSSCKHFNFYFHTIYFSVYSLSKQPISQFSNPASPPPRQKNNGPSLTFFNLHILFICKFPTISRLFFLKSLGETSSPGRFSSNKAREKRPGDEVGLGALR